MHLSPARRARLAVTAASLVALATVACTRPPVPPPTTTTTGPGGTTTTTPGPVVDYAARGPFATTSTVVGQNTYFYPTSLGTDGQRRPVILWGNGTGASVSVYASLLSHLASHGFVVAAANTTNAGSGTEMLAGLDYLGSTATAPFAGAVDTSRAGSTGHSQGGFGAVATTRDPRVRTTFPLEGATAVRTAGKTALFFAGQNDTIVSPALVRSAFTGSTVPAAYAELAGATHFTAIGNVGGFRGPLTAWARWQLQGDTAARGLFVGAGCGLCGNPAWSSYQANSGLQGL